MVSPDGIEITFCDPGSLNTTTPAFTLLENMLELGCQFLQRDGNVDLHPEQKIDKRGAIIIPYPFRHEAIAADLTGRAMGIPSGVARLGFVSDRNAALFSQTPGPTNESVDAIASGQVEFAKLMYAKLRPSYGWIDEPGENAEPIMNPTAKSIRYFFWATFFGPAIVQEIGLDVLMSCPASRTEPLEDGGLLLVATESFSDWFTAPPLELSKFLSTMQPKLEVYRSAGVS